MSQMTKGERNKAALLQLWRRQLAVFEAAPAEEFEALGEQLEAQLGFNLDDALVIATRGIEFDADLFVAGMVGGARAAVVTDLLREAAEPSHDG